MSVVEYYLKDFRSDINAVMSVSPYDGRRLSLACLVNGNLPSNFNDCHEVFLSLNNRVRFCFCLFFTTLIDQAIHHGLPLEHTHFDTHTQYPKIVGILGGAYSNCHPVALLGIATIYSDENRDDELTELAHFFSDDYRHFLKSTLPALPGRHSDLYDAETAVNNVFSSIDSALKTPPALSGFPYQGANRPPDKETYVQWIKIVRDCLLKT